MAEEKKAELVPAAKQSIVTIRSLLDRYKPELLRILPKELTPDLLARQVMTAIQKNPTIGECTPISVIGSVVECAQLGLSFDGTLGHAALVPFKANCTLMPMYRGYMELAFRTGVIGSIRAVVVRKKDLFHVHEGSDFRIEHERSSPMSMKEEDWIGAYSVIRYKDGFIDTEFMERDEILACKQRSPAVRNGRSTPWTTDPEAMWKKTVIRRHMRRTSLSAKDRRIEQMAALDEYRDAGAIKTGLSIDDYEFPQEGHAATDVISEPQPTPDEKKPKADRGRKKDKKSKDAAVNEPIAQPKRITEAQRQDLYRQASIACKNDYDKARAMVEDKCGLFGFERSSEVTVDKYAEIMREITGK